MDGIIEDERGKNTTREIKKDGLGLGLRVGL